MTAKGQEQPYAPSWVDRLTDWVAKQPAPGWVLYGGLGLGLILIQVLFLWLDGGLGQARVLLLVMIFDAALTPFALALMKRLDDEAVAALDGIRSTLDMSQAVFREFRYRLSNMPRLPALATGLMMAAIAILLERLWIAPARFAALEQLPMFTIVFQIFDKGLAFMFGVLTYHTVRQLGLVNTINARYVRIDLFNPGPAQAFSKLTASTAVGLVAGIYGWMLINPDLLADPVSLGFVGALTVLAAAVFVWPLWGVHRRVEAEKAQALRDIDQRFESLFARFDQHLGEGDYAETDRLHGTLAGLEIQRRRIGEIPTWPWRPETARFALAAIALPLILTVLQLLAQQAFAR